MAHTAKIGIIGAGISGLATAHYLLQQSLEQNLELEVTTLERSDRLGGVIWSEKTEGFLLVHWVAIV
jgi:oxygen-dependent protoporphyrinogen oxidase